MKRVLSLFLALLASLSLISCSGMNLELSDVLDEVIGFIDAEDGLEEESVVIKEYQKEREQEIEVKNQHKIEEDGHYTAQEDVALYIHTYNKLPGNFIKKRDAGDLGWEASKGNLWQVTDQMSIGGDRFGNREKILPIKDGRTYFECDINYDGKYRGAERIVYSNDGLVYYTGDHYETFTLLYGEEK